TTVVAESRWCGRRGFGVGRMFGGKSWSLGAWCLVCRFFGKLQKQLLVVGEMPGHGDCSPRTRGWTYLLDHTKCGGQVSPTHAGMGRSIAPWRPGRPG